MDGRNEDAVRLEVCDRINRELNDADWRRVYGRATQKLRHIITHFGDDGGARLTVDYIAQLTVEAIRAEALTQYTMICSRVKNEEPARMPTPQGHTPILLHSSQKCQDQIRRAHT